MAAVGVLVAAAAAVLSVAGGADGPDREPAGAPSAPPTSSPSVRASATPTVEPSPSPERRAIVIQGTGDVSLDPAYLPVFRERGYGWAWSGLRGLFRRDDLTVINLECPPTSVVAPAEKTFVFRCDPAALPAARRAGVEVANLANNHAFDQGPEGLLDGIANLRAAGIVPIGAGRSERAADAPRYVEVGGWRVALIGVGEVISSDAQVAVGERPGTAVGHDFPRALRAIRRAERAADLVVVAIHWGIELDTEPRAYQVAEAHRMVQAGADVIFGHHAHRLQPMEIYRGRPIFYGLGNFVWPRLSSAGATTAVARVVVGPNGAIRGRLVPATIVSSGHPELAV
jgi:poly-gamma-glutamate synthesis protein (capsule biosynthesis protein)